MQEMQMQEMEMQQEVKTQVENPILFFFLPKSPRSISDPKPCSARGVVTQLLSMSANESRTPWWEFCSERSLGW